MVKTCSKCKQNKPSEDFCKGRPECKECQKAYYEQNAEKIKENRKVYYKQNAEKIKEERKAYYEQNREKRIEYQKAYHKQNPEKIKERKKAYRKQNREKIKEREKAYRKQNREKIKKRQKAYYQQNAEKIKEQKKAYRKQNRDKMRIYYRNKRKTDINFKLTENLRKRVRKVLNGKSKSKNTLKLLGCSVDFFKKHLENQFQPGMSWENYGNPNGDHSECWHIDHIAPCASFDLSDPKQQQKCLHYSNLQPLWAGDNIRKGAKLDYNFPE
jgi:hypothetical protein